MKRCWKCKTEKEESDFHKGASKCKPCALTDNKMYRERYKANGGPGSARRYEYNDVSQYEMFKRARIRADKKNLPFNIIPSDLPIPKYCPVLGIPITRGDGHCTDASPSVDRIVPELGYVKGNVAVISYRANTLKNSATLEESEKITAWLRNHLE